MAAKPQGQAIAGAGRTVAGGGGCSCFMPVVSRNVSDLLWSQHFMGDGARQNLKGQPGEYLVLELRRLTIYNLLHL